MPIVWQIVRDKSVVVSDGSMSRLIIRMRGREVEIWTNAD